MNSKRLSKLIAGSFALKLFAAILGLIVYAYLAVILAVDEFGLFALVMSFALLAAGFAKQGVENLLVRFAHQLPRQQTGRLYISSVCWVLLCASFLAVIILLLPNFIVAVFDIPEIMPFLPWVAIYIILNSIQAVNAAMLNAQHKPKLSLLFNGIVSQTLFLLIVLISKPSSSLVAFELFVCVQAMSFIISQWVVIRVCKPCFKASEKLPAKRLFKVNFQYFSVVLLTLLTQQVPPLVVAKYASLEEVAFLAIAMKAALFFSYPLIAVNKVCGPHYAKLYHNNDFSALQKLATNSRWQLTWIASLGLAVVFLFLEPALAALDTVYIDSVPFIMILALGQWVNLATGSAVLILLMTGYESLHLKQNFIITCVFLVSLVIFTPLYGVFAAVVLMALAMACKNIISLYSVHQIVFKRLL